MSAKSRWFRGGDPTKAPELNKKPPKQRYEMIEIETKPTTQNHHNTVHFLRTNRKTLGSANVLIQHLKKKTSIKYSLKDSQRQNKVMFVLKTFLFLQLTCYIHRYKVRNNRKDEVKLETNL